ncbi:MAG TPA: hypothetical protein VFR62_07230 [Gemmatimonadales bacterium]|nr:hypothetical protein [Gemmatimonadales bacterium]
MTYTHKLARRLALSRDWAMLTVLLLAACAGDTTAPEAADPSAPSEPTAPYGFRVLPGSVTIEVDQRIRFRGVIRTSRGRETPPRMEWKASGGAIQPNGTFSASRPGTYRVIGRSYDGQLARMRAPDTAVVVVVKPQPKVVDIRVTPRTPELYAGGKRTFTAVGRLPDGTNTAIRVNWSATGGTVDQAGIYQARNEPGTYRVVATSTNGKVADTVPVVVLPASDPDTAAAPPSPVPTAARLVLRPATVLLATGGTHQFATFGRTSTGDSISVVDVSYSATGGNISETGLYTAGPTAGTYRVIATLARLADTATITLSAASGGGTPEPIQPVPPGVTGIPMGLSALIVSGREPIHYTASLDGYTASNIISRLNTARSKGLRVIMNMTGGSHDNYKTDGVFDYSKWKARMDTYDTREIRAAVAAAVADGTIIGNSVMDEPANESEAKGWGPPGFMTKARVDGLCQYVKQLFPTLPVGVVHDHRVLEPEKNYQVCDFVLSQYRLSKGPVTEFRDGGVAFAKRSRISIAFSLNILHGGTPGTDCEKWGDDPRGMLCPMTAEQVQDWGVTLGSAGCALNMWRYERAYYDKPEIQRALGHLAGVLKALPAKACRRT